MKAACDTALNTYDVYECTVHEAVLTAMGRK